MRKAIVGAIVGLGLVYAQTAAAVDMLRDEQGPTEAQPALSAEQTNPSDAAQHATRQQAAHRTPSLHQKRYQVKPHHRHYYYQQRGYYGERYNNGRGHYGYNRYQQGPYYYRHQKAYYKAKKSVNSNEVRTSKTTYNDDSSGALDATRASMIKNMDHQRR